MANLDAVIDDIVAGDDYTLVRTITGVPAGDSLAKAWWTCKRDTAEADADAVWQLEITSSSSAAGQITDTGSGDTQASVTLNAAPANTGKLLGDRWYEYDIQVLTANGKLYTPERGRLKAKAGVTRDAS